MDVGSLPRWHSWARGLFAAVVTALLAGSLVAVGATAASAATVDPNAWYVLVNRNSGKVVEVQGAATADGGNVVQYADWGGANQQWQLVRVDGASQGGLPSSFQWSSSGVLAGPRPNAQNPDVVAIKDFSVVRHNNQWQVYATAASPSRGWSLVHFAFGDWPQAPPPSTPTWRTRGSAQATGPHRRCSSSPRRTGCSSSTRAWTPTPAVNTSPSPGGWAC